MQIMKGVTNQGDIPSSEKPVLVDEQGRLVIAVGSGVAITISPSSIRSSASITRPANTTAYAANDVIGGALTFSAVASAGGYIMLSGVDFRYDVSAVPSGMAGVRLHLYSATPPSAYADNDAWDLPAGDRASYLGFIEIGTPVDLGSTLYVAADNLNMLRKLGTGETALYGYLVTLAGFTPAANSETAQVTLRGLAGL